MTQLSHIVSSRVMRLSMRARSPSARSPSTRRCASTLQGPKRSTQPRRALSTTYYADGARVLESPTLVSGRWRDFLPGVEPGGLAVSTLNPIVAGREGGFPLPAKLTVTAISGGQGYSMVPDLCTVNVDIRLTSALEASAAAALLHTAAADTDEAWPGTPPTGMDITTRWPPYALPDGSPLRDALLQGAARAGQAPVARSPGHPTSATTWPD